MSSSGARRLAADTTRLGLRYLFRHEARRKLGEVDIVYERQATFQDLGRPFQRRGSWWVLESNGPFWYEAGAERKSLALVETAKRLELAAYRDADLVIVVSEALKDIVVREAGRPSEDVYVLPNATDGDRFAPDRSRPRRVASGTTVGWVGYMSHWAGVDILIDAAARLRDQDQTVFLALVGDGPERSNLERRSASLGLNEQVTFLGNVPWDEVPDLMAGFDIAYSGQRAMSIGSMYHSPQKLYEYQAMALPIIASDFPDARKLVTAADSGWLFPPEDVGALADVIQLAADAGDLAEKGRRARADIVANHTWEVRVRELLSTLEARGMLRARNTRSQ
jgi:glycosyltransferase involved in cell wall biosynthesis